MGQLPTQRDADAQERLLRLFQESRQCTRCSTMPGHPRLLNEACGTAAARCLVLGEAPGRHGADRTGVPFHGDRTGENFERLLASANIRRSELFVSNAVLCSPRDDRGGGRKPTGAEIAACSHFVGALIECLDPVIVVTLGAKALGATSQVEPHGLTLKWDVGEVHRWHRRFLLPLYHPGARATIQRPWASQLRDWAQLASLLGRGLP